MPNPKMIQDPDDPTKMIANPDYDDTLNEDGTPIVKAATLSEETKALIAAAVKEATSKLKGSLDEQDAKRKAAETKVAEFERKEREAEAERLRQAGEHEKAFKLEKEQLEARLRDLESTNTSLTRDRMVEKALLAVEFRNAKSHDMAVSDITSQLVRDDNGVWAHKDGTDLSDFVATYLADEDNAFLLKSKKSSGSGADPIVTPSAEDNKSNSVFGLSTSEVLKRAEKGQLPHQQRKK